MAEKKREMATLGARLLEEHQTEGNETATAARMRHTGEHATLKTVAQSIEQALLQIVQWLAWWDGEGETPADVKSTVELHKEFFQIRATPDEVRALLEAWNDGAISFQTLFEGLQKGGWTREGATADEEKALVDGEKDERMKRAQEMMNATARTRMEAAVPPGDDPDDEPPPKPAVQRKAA
jgi:prophage DNA circulation protein